MSWNLPTPAEEWDHYGEAELELASLEEAAGPLLDPTDPEGILHGFPTPVVDLPWWEHEEAADHLAELANAMAMDFPGSTITIETVKYQLRLEAAEAAAEARGEVFATDGLRDLEPFGYEWTLEQEERMGWAA